MSQVLVLISLHFFVSGASNKQRHKIGVMAAAQAGSPMAQTPVPMPSLPSLQRTLSDGAVPRTHAGQSWAPQTPVTPMDASRPTPTPTAAAAAPVSKATAAATSIWPFGSLAMKITFLIVGSVSLLLALFVESDAGQQRQGVSPVLSLFTSAILLAVPVTHLLARRSLTHAGYLLFQPFKGGSRFVALQAIAWTLWTVAFVSAGASFLFVISNSQHALQSALDEMTDAADKAAADSSVPQWRWISSLVTSAGVGGVLSQALVLLSLKYFDKKLSSQINYQTRILDLVRQVSQTAATAVEHMAAASTGSKESQSPRVSATLLQTPSNRVLAASPSTAALATPLSSEHELYARASQVLNSPRAHALLSSPHLLLGDLRGSPMTTFARQTSIPTPANSHARSIEEDEEETDDAPTLVLPDTPARSSTSPRTSDGVVPVDSADLSGTPELIALQPSATPELPSSLASLSLGELSQSFHLYAHQWRSTNVKELLVEWCADIGALAVVTVFYFVPIIGALLMVLPIAAFAMHWRSLPWYAYAVYFSSLLAYLSTYRNRPSLTGSRSWDAVRHSSFIWASLERYFRAQIISLGELDVSKGPYIFGFHPHGQHQ